MSITKVTKIYRVNFSLGGETIAAVRAFSADDPEHAAALALKWISAVHPGESFVALPAVEMDPPSVVGLIMALDTSREESDAWRRRATPSADGVAGSLLGVLPRGFSCYNIELIASTSGCVARAIVGATFATKVEISGLGATLPEAIVAIAIEASTI